MAVGFGARAGIAPTRAPEARAPLAKPTAPVALQQSRILRATLDVRLQGASHQQIAAARRGNPVLNRLCPVLFRPRQLNLPALVPALPKVRKSLIFTPSRFF